MKKLMVLAGERLATLEKTSQKEAKEGDVVLQSQKRWTVTDAEKVILNCLQDVKGRGASGLSPEGQASLDQAVELLEQEAVSSGIGNPTNSPLLEGRWRLLYTSRPGTASPIQRTFTGVDSFSVFQEISFQNGQGGVPRVLNVVDFGGIGTLKVEAEASTDQRPLPNFTPREGKGLPFGFLGVSLTDAPVRKNLRIDFQFDKAAFYFKFLPFSVPYPVPFKILGDERKGWIDVTYLSRDGTFRLTRGNKGTLFVLVKDDPPAKRLIDNMRSTKKDDASIEEDIESFLASEGPGQGAPAKSPLAMGAWRLLWTKQGPRANLLQRALSNQVKNWQIIGERGSRVENRVELLPGVRIRALADAKAEGNTRTRIDINEVFVELGRWRIDLPLRGDNGYIDWLYLDDELRITRGSKGSLFVHLRDPSVEEGF